MTPTDLDKIEQRLGIDLPESYGQIVLNFPFDHGTTDDVLWDHADAIIDQTLQHREGMGGATPKWPRHFVFVGCDGAASPYVLDTKTSPPMVLHLDHGNPGLVLGKYPSLQGFVAERLNERDAELKAPPMSRGAIVSLCLVIAGVALAIGLVLSRVVFHR
jgi:hypothetical protein